MIRHAFIAVCFFGLGVLVRDQAEDRKPQEVVWAVAPPILMPPIQCDATVEQRTKPTERWSRKCYIRGVRT